MKLTRIKAYRDNNFMFEMLYATDSHVKALEKFYTEFQECKNQNYICMAETLNTENPKHLDFIMLAMKCGLLRSAKS